MNRVRSWAVDEGLIEANTAARLRKVGTTKPCERVLPAADIKRLWHAPAAVETMTGEAVKASPAKSRFVFPSAEAPLRAAVTPMAITRAMARVVADYSIAVKNGKDCQIAPMFP